MAALWNKDGYRNNRSENYSFKNPISFVKNETNIRNEMNQNFPATSIETINTNSQSCARQALNDFYDSSVIELAAYLDETLFIPKKMSFMAEMIIGIRELYILSGAETSDDVVDKIKVQVLPVSPSSSTSSQAIMFC
ncbi:hypothetical protein QR98_0103670 [Sarcoptes scabiei]|uniref:Uncharacterized protein n=1 Tax=Sarcoptes scabiei TaxID=52283 RepID=A0A132ALA7_SARSC|nr:hypothetical protein QR98_0103670 [Sarcoptes scabiei]